MNIIERAVGAAKLDYPTYREIAGSTPATAQAAMVVAVAALSTAVGRIRDESLDVVLAVGGIAIANWLIYSVLFHLIGTRILTTKDSVPSSLGSLLRTVGFAQSPATIGFFGVIPGLGLLTQIVATTWTLVAMIFAIKITLSIGSGRAIAIVIASMLVTAALVQLIVAPFDLSLLPQP